MQLGGGGGGAWTTCSKGQELAPVQSSIAVRANGSTGSMCCVRSRECVGPLVHVVQGGWGLHWHYCGVTPGYVAADG